MFFHYLSGTVAAIEQNLAVVDCGGVGYECSTTAYTISQLRLGQVHKLYTHCNIREDAFEIYGFSTREEKRCFELLLSVSGVGPKAALNILSATTPSGFQLAVASGDERALTAAQGVGKKLAQRVLLELKDKLKLDGMEPARYWEPWRRGRAPAHRGHGSALRPRLLPERDCPGAEGRGRGEPVRRRDGPLRAAGHGNEVRRVPVEHRLL